MNINTLKIITVFSFIVCLILFIVMKFISVSLVISNMIGIFWVISFIVFVILNFIIGYIIYKDNKKLRES